MLHLALHAAVPVLVALAFYHSRWRRASLVLLATMLVDVDHLLADPVYDPERCSIGFHPLHGAPAIALWAALFSLPLVLRRDRPSRAPGGWADTLHLVGLGLMIHMALDATDCVL